MDDSRSGLDLMGSLRAGGSPDAKTMFVLARREWEQEQHERFLVAAVDTEAADDDKVVLWRRALECCWEPSLVFAGPDFWMVVKLDDHENPPPSMTVEAADLDTGRPRWSETMEGVLEPVGVAAGNGRLALILMDQEKYDRDGLVECRLYDAKTGAREKLLLDWSTVDPDTDEVAHVVLVQDRILVVAKKSLCRGVLQHNSLFELELAVYNLEVGLSCGGNHQAIIKPIVHPSLAFEATYYTPRYNATTWLSTLLSGSDENRFVTLNPSVRLAAI